MAAASHSDAATMPIPRTMKAIVLTKLGGPEVLEYRTDVPVPQPGAGQILVKNEYIGVNYIDTYFRTGLYPSTRPILGIEAEGTVVAVGGDGGDTYGMQPGDRVVWTDAGGGSGAYAEYSAAPALHAAKVPASLLPLLPPAHAVTAFVQGLTALALAREAHPVQQQQQQQPGEWVLVHAAAGGCGLWLCRVLRRAGARVIGTVSGGRRGAKARLARRHGAGWVVDYTSTAGVAGAAGAAGGEGKPEGEGKEKEEGEGGGGGGGGEEGDWVARVRAITGGQGVAAVFDGVGRATFDGDLEVLARKGTLVSFGNASGDVPPFAIRRLAAKNIRLLRPQLFGYLHTREEFTRYVDELFQFIADEVASASASASASAGTGGEGDEMEMINDNDNNQGEETPEEEGAGSAGLAPPIVIHTIYPLENAAEAHRDLETRKTTGKLLLKP